MQNHLNLFENPNLDFLFRKKFICFKNSILQQRDATKILTEILDKYSQNPCLVLSKQKNYFQKVEKM